MACPSRLASLLIRFLTTSLALSFMAGPASALIFNPELREITGENPFARNVYLCNCTAEQFDAVPLPGSNWEKTSTLASPRFLIAEALEDAAPPAD